MTTPDTTQAYMRLLGAVRDHLAAHPLPAAIASVEVGANSIEGEHATVHLRTRNLADLATALLAWADTLTEITVSAWRPPDSDRVHLSVTGRLTDGLPVKIYSSVPHTTTVFGTDLQPGGQHSLALSTLRTWATDGALAA